MVAAFWSYVQASRWSIRGTSLTNHWRGYAAQTQTCGTYQHYPGNGRLLVVYWISIFKIHIEPDLYLKSWWCVAWFVGKVLMALALFNFISYGFHV